MLEMGMIIGKGAALGIILVLISMILFWISKRKQQEILHLEVML